MIITSILFKEKIALIRISIEKAINKQDWGTSIRRIEDVKAQYPQHEFYYSFHLEALVYPYQQKHFANLIGNGVLLIEQLTQKSLKYLSDLTASLHPEATVLLQPEALNLGTAIWIELAKNTRLQLANIIFCKPLDKDARLKTIRELLSYIPYAAYLQISSDCSEIMFEAQLSNISQGKRVLLPSKLTPEQCGWLGKYALPGARIYFPSDIETETAVNVLKALKKNQYVILHPDTPARLIYQLLSALTPNERGYTFEFDFPREGLYPSRVDDSSGSTIASSASLSMDRLLKLDDSIRIPQDINPDLLARLLEDSEIIFKTHLSTLTSEKEVRLPSKLTPKQCRWLGEWALPDTSIYFPSNIETETAVNALKALKKNQYVILHPDTPARLIYQLLSALTPNERGCSLEFDFPREGLYPSRVDDSSGSTIASSTSLSMNRLLRPYDCISIRENLNSDLFNQFLKNEASSINILFHKNADPQNAVQIVAKIQDNPFTKTLFLSPYLSKTWINEFIKGISESKLRCKISIMAGYNDDWLSYTVSRIPAGCQFYLPWNISISHAKIVLQCLVGKDVGFEMPPHTLPETRKFITPCLQFNNHIPAPDNINPVEQNKVSNTPTPPSTKHEESPDVELFAAETPNADLFNQFLKNEVSSINILFHENADPQNAVQIVAKIQDNPFTKTLFLSPYLSKTWINEFIMGISESKLRCKISIMAGYNDDWLSYTVSRIPAGCQFYLPWNISISHAKIVLQCLVGKDVGFEMPPHTLPETRKFITPCLQFNNHIPAPDNINPVEQNKVSNTLTPPSTKHEESPDVQLFGAKNRPLDIVGLFVDLFGVEYIPPDIETPTLDIVDSFFDKTPLPLSAPAPLLPSTAPQALVPQTQRPSLLSDYTLTLSDSLWLGLTEIPPKTGAPAHSSPPANVRLTSHMFSRAPKVSQEETEANEGFKAFIERQRGKSIIRMPATFPFPFPSPRFIENTLKRSKGIIKLHPKTDPALATWIASALPPNVALMLPPELIAVPETAKAIVDVLKPECTLYVDAFSPELPEAIQILHPKVTLLLNMNKLGLLEARHLVSALPSACNLALVISRTNFIQLKDSLPELINSLKAGCTLKVDMTWEVEDVRWLASRLSPGIGLFVPPSRRSTEDPSSLSPTKVEAITSKLIPGTLVATQAKPDATVHGNTSPHDGFFSSRPTTKRSACEPITVSAISSSSNSSKHSHDNSETDAANFTPPYTSDKASGNDPDGWPDDISLREAKKLSLATYPHTSDLWQQIGPRELPTMGTLVDVPDDGDCFFHAILHQSKRPEIAAILGGSELTVSMLRQQTPGISTEPGSWADHDDIHRFVAHYPACILAVIDTRAPDSGFTSYYQSVDKEVITHSGELEPLPDRPIIYIAHNGNHFLSVTHFNAIGHGSIQNGFDYRACFLSDDEQDCSSDESSGHSNMKRQRT